jgi:hypothetical protein
VLPGVAAVLLLGAMRWRGGAAGWGRRIVGAAVAAGVGVGAVWGAGVWLNESAGVEVRVTRGASGERVLLPRNAGAGVWVVLPDGAVLGEDAGKLLRRLAVGLRREVRVNPADAVKRDGLLACGRAVGAAMERPETRVVLVHPVAVEPSVFQAWRGRVDSLTVWSPGLDEDGRGARWEQLAALGLGGVRHEVLDGLGVEVSWRWGEVVERVTAGEPQRADVR